MRLLLTLSLILAISYLNAQIITVRDKDTYEQLEFVTITNQDFTVSEVTNSLGQASGSKFSLGDIIEIRMIGYATLKISYEALKDRDFKVFLSPSIFSIDQVVVSATKWRQPSIDVPVKVRSISKNLISFSNPQTSADLLGITGDVFIQKSQQGGGSPMIRGFAANRLVIAVDGVRMNNAIFRAGNLQNVISLDPFSIEKTEVLFGPGSVIYGSDAIGGVMNFYTLTPKLSNDKKSNISGGVTTRFSSANNEKTGHIHFNYGREKWATLTNISFNQFDHVTMGSRGPAEYLRNEYVVREGVNDMVVKNPDPKKQLFSGYDQLNFMQKIRLKPNELWGFSFNLLYSETSNFDRYDRLIAYKYGLPRSAEWYYGPQVWLMNSIKAEYKNKHIFIDQLTLSASYQLFKESRHSRGFNDDILQSRYERVNAFGVNIDLNKTLNSTNRIYYGIESVVNFVASEGFDKNITTNVSSAGASRYPKSNWSSYALYFTYQSELTEKLNLQAGGRYNLFLLNAEFDNSIYPFPFTTANLQNDALTGSLGLTYKPWNQWRINTIVSTGFRAPNVDDMGKIFDSSPGMIVIPNPDLKSEYAMNGEFSITKLFGDFLEIDFLTYYTLLDDAMVRRNSTLNGQDSIIYDGALSRVQSIQNAAEARVWGVQADFELKFLKWFELSSRFNYQKGEEELDDGSISPLRHAAPHFGTSSLTFSTQNLILKIYVNYSGEISYDNLAEEERGKPHIYAIDSNGNPYSPSWYTLNLRTQYKFSKYLLLSATVENITDKRYKTYSSGMVASGLNLMFSVTYSF